MKKNILFILVDQWPAKCFGHKGDTGIRTPNMDKLAREGTVFNNAFTSNPLCSPARGTLLTGRWNNQTNFLDNIGVGYSVQDELNLDIDTWLDGAVKNDYHVGYFGKWHLGKDGPKKRKVQASSKGVDSFFKEGREKALNYNYSQSHEEYIEGGKELLEGIPPFYGRVDRKVEDTRPLLIVDEAIEFIEDYKKNIKDKPFMMTTSINDPHFPHYLPSEWIDEVGDIEIELPESLDDDFHNKPHFHNIPWWPSMDTSKLTREQWKDVIKYAYMHRMLVDKSIGKLLDKLKESGLEEDTIVIFTSDHGDMCGAHNRFDKGPYYYDEVWRIPLIIKDPQKPSAIRDELVSILDVGATIFDLLDYTPKEKLEGKSLDSLVGNNEIIEWSKEVYGMYDVYNGMSFKIRAIRDNRYKYIYNPQSIDELYDLVKDPYEMKNLSDNEEYNGIKCQLKERLNNWMTRIEDPLLTRKTSVEEAGMVGILNRVGP